MTRTIVGIVLLTASISVSASHSFNIKVVNQATHDIEVRSVSYDAKGPSLSEMAPADCVHVLFQTYSPGESRQCAFTARVKKWQRRIEVRFMCPNSIAGAIYFPRNKKWFKRDYLDKNNNTYTVRIKGSDCN